MLQAPSLADDIRDFQIEGISIGDSVLNFFSEEEKIKSVKTKSQYPNDNFIVYDLEKLIDIKNYDYGIVTAKKKDKNYIITNVSGSIIYEKLDECLKLKTEIQTEIEKIFKSVDKQETSFSSVRDKTGNSKIYGVQYYFKPHPSEESITVNCYNFTPESGIEKSLKVAVNTHEYAYFIINEAYK